MHLCKSYVDLHILHRTIESEANISLIFFSRTISVLWQEHMIQNEVSILRRVKHPNIVLLIEEMDMPTELYLVMELVKV